MEVWGHQMTTEKNRVKVSLSDEACTQLKWLLKEKKEELKRRVYPCDVVEQLIKNEYTIKKTFRK